MSAKLCNAGGQQAENGSEEGADPDRRREGEDDPERDEMVGRHRCTLFPSAHHRRALLRVQSWRRVTNRPVSRPFGGTTERCQPSGGARWAGSASRNFRYMFGWVGGDFGFSGHPQPAATPTSDIAAPRSAARNLTWQGRPHACCAGCTGQPVTRGPVRLFTSFASVLGSGLSRCCRSGGQGSGLSASRIPVVTVQGAGGVPLAGGSGSRRTRRPFQKWNG